LSHFRFSLNTSTIQPANLVEKIRIAGAAGYDGIEIWNDDLDAYVGEGGLLQDVRKMLADAGLEVPTVLHISGWLDAADGPEYSKALEDARRRMDQAAAIGAQRIIAGPPRGACDYQRSAKRYAELLAIGREYGVLPALEFLGFVQEVNTIRALWKIVSAVDDGDKSVVLDTYHIFRGGSSIEDLDLVPTEMIAVFHVNDAPANIPREQQRDADRVLPGDGILPLEETARRLKAKGYRGALSLELFNPSLWQRDLLDVAKEGLERMRMAMDQEAT